MITPQSGDSSSHQSDVAEAARGAHMEQASLPSQVEPESPPLGAEPTMNLQATAGSRAFAVIKRSLVADDPLTRRMTAAALVNSFGNGLLATTTAIYFTRFVDISNHQLALTYTAAAVLTMLLAVPVGRIVDGVRPRKFAIYAISTMGVLSLTNAFVANLPQFVFVQLLFTCAEVAMRVNQQTYIGRLRQGAERVTMMSYQRAVMNLGLGIGSAVSGIALTINHANAFKILFVLDALTWFGNAAIRSTLPDLEPIGSHARQGRAIALRDRRWVAASLINGLTEMHNVVLMIGVPLWVDQFTTAPKSVVAASFLVNTVMVAALQVRFGRGTHEPRRAADAYMRSSWWIFVAMVLYPLAFYLDQPLLAAAVILAGAVLHTIGELTKSAGAWGIQYGLVPPQYQGQYQAVWMMGRQINDLLGPPLVAFLCLGWGLPGWLTLGGLIVALGMLMPSLVKRALLQQETPGQPANS